MKSLLKVGGPGELLIALSTSLTDGIDQVSITQRVEMYSAHRYGNNHSLPPREPSLWAEVLLAFNNRMLQILIAAALVALVVGLFDDPNGGWIEGVAILLAVCIVVTVTAVNNYLKERQFQKLSARSGEVTCTVVRESHEEEIPTNELVVGDILKVKTGMTLPADGVFLEAHSLKVDESSLTGESDLVRKMPFTRDLVHPANPFGLSSSKVEEGSGTMVVCAVGRNSTVGEIERLLKANSGETALQMKLTAIADHIGRIGAIAAVITFLLLVAHVFYASYRLDAFNQKTVRGVVDSFIMAVTIVVVAVPEGLPLAVTLSMAYTVGKMQKENNLVRNLDSCETMGGATDICTDKTGTLTKNRMMVVAAYIEGKNVHKKMDKDIEAPSNHLREILGRSFCLNSDASLVHVKGSEDEQRGNRTECALLSLAKRWKFSYDEMRRQCPIAARVPFSSDWKWMSSVWDDGQLAHVYVKGAAEVVLPMCTHIYDADGPRELTPEDVAAIGEKVVGYYANDSLRTIALAYKSGEYTRVEYVTSGDPNREFFTSGLTLIGIFGIQDPLREEVIGAVAAIQRAKITVRMVTGDNVDTAVSIARRCGILPRDYKKDASNRDFVVMEGADFEKKIEGMETVQTETGSRVVIKNMDMFTRIASNLAVLARSSPRHKFMLVTGLQSLAERVVAVTGDGSNDAPALRKSDVGFAMNIAGTQLAKDAADILLVDDNFASIVTAVKWGRNIYDSIKKFIQFQLIVNFVALSMSVLGALTVSRSPLTAIQMLWVNLIMDTFAALALATEPPNDDLLTRKPYKKTESLIDSEMKKTIVGTSVYQVICLVIVLYLGPTLFKVYPSWEEEEWSYEGFVHFTLFFNTFVYLQVFSEINCRKLKSSERNVFSGFFNNPLFLAILALTVVAQVLIVQFGGEALGCNKLSLSQHLTCAAIGAGTLANGFIVRKLPTRWFTWPHIDEKKEIKESAIYRLLYGRTAAANVPVVDVKKALLTTLFKKKVN